MCLYCGTLALKFYLLNLDSSKGQTNSGFLNSFPNRYLDPRFVCRGSMTSNVNWSDRTDQSAPPQPISTGLGASPSQVIASDDYIAENSDLFREAISARNVYAAWARKLTNARPNDPKMQSYHQEVTLAGETVNSLLVKLNVLLFRIPASEKELERIVLRVKVMAGH
ncbi:hypothetical protein TNCV_1064261 [Trichonephila clavipes]|nr:hypothetical protein TNCV_1064261 [Trichonephila clavipes]